LRSDAHDAARDDAARIWYYVRDVAAARAFYTETLGFAETYVGEEGDVAELERDGVLIALSEGEPQEQGVAAIDVDDARAEAERLRKEDVEVGVVLELAGEVRLVDVFDPDGNRVQLVEQIAS
jgi:catechol 2,3-dioxygenase-like lactoylglutathione lyase family enzyme